MSKDCEDFHEYNERLKVEKQKLHVKYIAGICITIAAVVLAYRTSDVQTFVDQLSFASTIASIILSVLAIIMSISGEGKTEGIRSQMTETTLELRKTVETVQTINDGVITNLKQLQDGMNELQMKIELIPDNTAEKVYAKNHTLTKTRRVQEVSGSNERWSKINDKQN